MPQKLSSGCQGLGARASGPNSRLQESQQPTWDESAGSVLPLIMIDLIAAIWAGASAQSRRDAAESGLRYPPPADPEPASEEEC